MFRACEPMRMMHMFVCCHVYLEYHLNIFQIFRPGDQHSGSAALGDKPYLDGGRLFDPLSGKRGI